MTTVLLSTFAHGLSAMPGIELYARRCAMLGPDAPERRAAPAHAEGSGGALH